MRTVSLTDADDLLLLLQRRRSTPIVISSFSTVEAIVGNFCLRWIVSLCFIF